MGASSSKSKNVIESDVLNKNITAILNKNSTIVSTSSWQNQYIELHVTKTGELNCNNIELSQKMSSSMKLINTITNSVKNDIVNEIKNALAHQIDSNNSASSGWGGIGMSDANSINRVKTTLKNIVETSMTAENLNQIVNRFDFKQNNTVTIDGKVGGPDCENFKMSQDMQINLVTNNIISTLNENIAKSTEANEISDVVKSKTSASVEGVFEAISKLLSNPVVIIIIIVCIIAAVAYFMFGRSGGGGGGVGGGGGTNIYFNREEESSKRMSQTV